MSLEMAHKVIVPQKKIISRSFLKNGTLIVIPFFPAGHIPVSSAKTSRQILSLSPFNSISHPSTERWILSVTLFILSHLPREQGIACLILNFVPPVNGEWWILSVSQLILSRSPRQKDVSVSPFYFYLNLQDGRSILCFPIQHVSLSPLKVLSVSPLIMSRLPMHTRVTRWILSV